MTTITFSTCWYPLKAKFPDTTYFEWMDNLLSNVVNYYLVVYTDESQYPMLYSKYGLNENIKFIVKPLEQFYNYKHRDFWINNHTKNTLLNSRTNWELNMLWSEKVHFVNETMTNLYFEETEYYGWMDIGYFRCRPSLDIGKESIKLFPNKEKIQWLNPDKIHYALVNMDIEYMPSLINIIRSGNPIPPNQVSVAGGFFIGHKTKIGWWRDTYQYKLETYIAKSSLVKDDQIIIADCIFSELMGVNFELHHEFKPFRVSNAKRLTPVSLKNAHVMGVFNEKRCKRLYPRYDPWFLFSYYLL